MNAVKIMNFAPGKTNEGIVPLKVVLVCLPLDNLYLLVGGRAGKLLRQYFHIHRLSGFYRHAASITKIRCQVKVSSLNYLPCQRASIGTLTLSVNSP